MIWHKTWLDTRTRFLVGLGLMICAAVTVVQLYPRLTGLLNTTAFNAPGPDGDRIREGIALTRSFRGYVWSQWFLNTPVKLGTLFAVLLGSGGLLSRGSQGAALFTLSLPVSRGQLVSVRAAAGFLELLVIAVVPSLLIPLTAPSVGQSYGIGEALVHAVCLSLGWTLFFTLALALSTVWDDLWKPLLLACAVAFVIALAEGISPAIARFGPYSMMSGETYFRHGQLPWAAWAGSAVISVALVYGATRNFASRDF